MGNITNIMAYYVLDDMWSMWFSLCHCSVQILVFETGI